MKKIKERNIPDVLDCFFKSPGGHSLIIKGKPGVGKTSLALEIMQHFQSDFKTHYISARVDEKNLYYQFPWLKSSKQKEELLVRSKKFLEIVEHRLSGKDAEERARDILDAMTDKPHAINLVSRKELNILEGRIMDGEEELTEEYDVIPSTGPIFGNKEVIMDVLSLLPEVEYAYDLIDAELPEKTLLVIDSLESLSEKYGIKKRKLLSMIQKDLVENTESNIIFVLEEETEDAEPDFLVDGVVVLNLESKGGRHYRYMDMKKLRSCPIDRFRIPYTLHGGRFQSLINATAPQKTRLPLKDRSEALASTGIKDLDDIIGGFRRGAINSFCMGKNISESTISATLMFMLVNNIMNERVSCVILPGRTNHEMLCRSMSLFFSKDDLKKYLRIFVIGEACKSVYMDDDILVSLPGIDFSSEFNCDVIKATLPDVSDMFVFLPIDTLDMVYKGDVIQSLSRFFTEAMTNNAVILTAFYDDSEYKDRIFDRSAFNMICATLYGADIIYCEKPFTSYYQVQSSLDPLNISLRPIV